MVHHNPSFTINKIKELIVDFKNGMLEGHMPVSIGGLGVERISNFKLRGNNISGGLSSAQHAYVISKRACQHLYFLRCLKRFGRSLNTPIQILQM